MEPIKSQERLWLLRCKNAKCGTSFDYFGRLRRTAINCTNCGKRYEYDVADFRAVQIFKSKRIIDTPG